MVCTLIYCHKRDLEFYITNFFVEIFLTNFCPGAFGKKNDNAKNNYSRLCLSL